MRKTLGQKLKTSTDKKLSQLGEAQANLLLEIFIDAMKENIIEKRGLVIQDFGSFSREIKKRTRVRVPSTKEIKIIPQRVALSFTSAPNFVEKLK